MVIGDIFDIFPARVIIISEHYISSAEGLDKDKDLDKGRVLEAHV